MNTNPRKIKGNWTHGWALDEHTISSVHIGVDDQGHDRFETTRTEMGEALNKLKYRGDRAQVEPIARTMAEFILSRPELSDIRAIIGVPPSNTKRKFQPVPALTGAIGAKLHLAIPTNYLLKTKQTVPLKGVSDIRDRDEELKDAFKIADKRFSGAHVLLVDDLFRSGATLNAISTALISQGKVVKVFVVTATVTRTKR